MSARRHNPGGIAAVAAIAAAWAILAGSPNAWALQGPAPGAVSANTVKLPDGPASVHGLGDKVSTNLFTAQVGYSVPIDLPAGVAGFGPHLALTYSGDLGNGPLGIGWTLPTIEIRRSTRHGVPAFDDTDELELTGLGGGGRLIPNPDVTGEYLLEGQGLHFRIIRHEASFEITDSAGTHYLLGQTAEGRQAQGARVAAWFVQWILNIVGQEMRFSYSQETGEVYLKTITWGPTIGNGPPYSVTLTNDARPDIVTSYRTGFRVQTGSRLTHVEVKAFTRTLRRYDLTYDDAFRLSRLKQVAVLGLDLADSGIPPVTFTYALPESAAVVTVPGVGGWVLNQRGVSLADVDGDGTADLLRLESGNHTYRQNHHGVFLGERSLQGASDVDLEGSSLIDLDGDSRPELVRVVDDTWRAYRLVGETWSSMGEWPGTRNVPLHDAAWVLADVNGDGRIDAIQGRTGGVSVRFNGIAGMGPPTSLPAISPSDVEVQPGATNVRFHDMNGDGIVDVVWLTDAWMKIFLGRGDGTFVPFDRVTYPWRDTAVAVTDIQLADLNRDGLMDLIRTTAAQVQWFAGLPNLHFSAAPRTADRPEGASSDAVVTIADANGNGSQDVVWSSTRGLWVLDLAGATSAGMLTAIDNGMGQVTRIEYSSSAAISADADRSGAPWDHKLPTAIPVPTRVEVDSGGGVPPVVSEHSVRDGMWDGVERRFGGFLQSLTREIGAMKSTTLVEEQRYHAGLGADRALRGKTWWTKRSSDDGYVFDVKETTWNAFQLPSLANIPDPPFIASLRALPQPAAQVPSGADLLRVAVPQTEGTFVYEGQAVPIETRVNYQHDDFARPTQETHLGVASVMGDERVVRRQYATDDESTWIRDKVMDEQVTELDGTLVSETKTYYGTPTGPVLGPGSVGLGYVRRVDERLVPPAPDVTQLDACPVTAPRDVTQSTTLYDACGNPAVVYAGGVTRTLTYEDCLFARTESVSPDGGTPLTWSMVWDEVRGVPSELTDPNGAITHVDYDASARPVDVKVIPYAPHIHYAYDWAHPLPTTTTSIFDGPWSALSSANAPPGPGWRSTTTVANGGGQALYATTAVGDGRTIVSGWKIFDERGHVQLAAEPFYAPQLPPVAPPMETRTQTFDYDAASRLVHQTLPNGAVKTVIFGQLSQIVQSPELADVRSDLDGLGRVVTTQRQVSSGLEIVAAKYDAADRILEMSLQGGAAVHRFQYDTLGRLTFASDPDTGDRRLCYDDRSFLVDHVNGANEHVYFDYDLAGRLTRRGETSTPNSLSDYLYTYDDPAGAVSSGCQVRGRLASVIEPTGAAGPTGEVHLCYDVLGRSSKLARTIIAAAVALHATDPATVTRTASEQTDLSPSGLTLGESFDDGFATTYSYDGAGRATAVSSGGTQLWHATVIDAAGRVDNEAYGNGATEDYSYDRLGLTQSVDLHSTVGGQVTDLFNILVTRTTFGAPKTVTDQDGGNGLNHSATYTYDDAARLTGATLGSTGDPGGQYAFTFRYDGLQNMIYRDVKQNGTVKDIGVLAGVYKYGERGYGPRQLTSVIP
jgi:YD repeat-containing protein